MSDWLHSDCHLQYVITHFLHFRPRHSHDGLANDCYTMAQEPPLDEIQWRSPKAQEMGGIHTNTGKSLPSRRLPKALPSSLNVSLAVLPYFAESPFFDATSNNAILTTQALYNPNMYYIIQTREAFEGRLRTMQGLEFMVTHDPSENDTKPNHNGVWVVRKQTRRKRQGAQDEVTGISSYYVVGENVYMAPSVGNVLGSRLVWAILLLHIGRVDLGFPALDGYLPHEAPFHSVFPS